MDTIGWLVDEDADLIRLSTTICDADDQANFTQSILRTDIVAHWTLEVE